MAVLPMNGASPSIGASPSMPARALCTRGRRPSRPYSEDRSGLAHCPEQHGRRSATTNDEQSPFPGPSARGGPRRGRLVPEQEPTAGLPLSGVRLIDVGRFLAGPYAAFMMGDFGAEVIKVEHPISGDPMRRFVVPTKREDATLAWLSEARNRKSVTIDLRQRRGAVSYTHLTLPTNSEV